MHCKNNSKLTLGWCTNMYELAVFLKLCQISVPLNTFWTTKPLLSLLNLNNFKLQGNSGTLNLKTLGFCDHVSWAKCEERDRTNKMQQSVVYYQLLSQHVSGIIMPIFRRTKALLLSLVCCSGSVGCGW